SAVAAAAAVVSTLPLAVSVFLHAPRAAARISPATAGFVMRFMRHPSEDVQVCQAHPTMHTASRRDSVRRVFVAKVRRSEIAEAGGTQLNDLGHGKHWINGITRKKHLLFPCYFMSSVC